MRNCPGSHISAIGPARYGKAFGIGNALLYKEIDAGHDVAIIGAAPISSIGAYKAETVAGGAADVGRKYDKAARNQELGPIVDPMFPASGWTSMDQRHSRPSLRRSDFLPRLEQRRLYFEPTLGRIADKFGLDQLRKTVVQLADPALLRRVHDPQFLRVDRGAANISDN